MEIMMKLDNLEKNLEGILKDNLNDTIKDTVINLIQKETEEQVKDYIKEEVNLHIKNYVEEYIKTAKVKTGGGFYSNEEEKEYTVEQFLKKEIAECMEKKSFTIYKEDRYGKREEQVSFEEFIKKEFNIDDKIRGQLKKFMIEVKNDVNNRLKNQFNEVTKQTLSDTMLTLLLQNETFTKIQQNLASIATKE